MAGRVGIVAKYPTLVDELKKYPPPEGVKLKYGTAGFREKAAILDSTFFRMGMLGILRSRQLEKTIGLMVTASHNAAPDNGRPTAISSPVAPQRRRAGPQEVARDRQTVVTISDFLPCSEILPCSEKLPRARSPFHTRLRCQPQAQPQAVHSGAAQAAAAPGRARARGAPCRARRARVAWRAPGCRSAAACLLSFSA
jgi:hypothetical protein